MIALKGYWKMCKEEESKKRREKHSKLSMKMIKSLAKAHFNLIHQEINLKIGDQGKIVQVNQENSMNF